MKNPFKKYGSLFTEGKFWNKIKSYATQAGLKGIYSSLLLFYAYQREDTPRWAKNIIVGTLGYFLAPIDAVPDLTPFIGYTDDVGVLSFGLVTIAAYINEEVRGKAKTQLDKWFKDYDEEVINEVEELL